MSGIAGILSLQGTRPGAREIVRRMSAAQAHRGQFEATFAADGIVMSARSNGPISDSQIAPGDAGRRLACVVDGQLYNAEGLCGEMGLPRMSAASRPELLAELWRRCGASMCERLRGQFAFALWDEASRRLLLARDHFGVCPLHWSRQGDVLLFASEIKSLLASGLVDAQVDLRGVHHVWTFFGVPGPVTCFAGVSALLPGRYLEVVPARSNAIREGTYWQMNFPDHGQEDHCSDETALVDTYESVMLRSLGRRLESSESVALYSSGGLDSSLLVAMGTKLRGTPLETYTFRIQHPGVDESGRAEDVVAHVGNRAHVEELSGRDLYDAFPRLVAAAESPVIDASASALLRLAEAARAGGHRVVITGEGADELQAGYPWFRIQERLNWLDRLSPLPVSRIGFRTYVRLVHSQKLPWWFVERSYDAVGGKNAWLLAYMLMAAAKYEFFGHDTLRTLGDHVPLDDLALDQQGLRRWHPLNRSVYLGTRIHLPGLHLAARGDRAAGRSGVEGRYPFLERELFDFLAPLGPEWKFRKMTDKYLQRQLAKRWLPESLGAGRKSLLHAPLDALHQAPRPAWAEQLLSDESLRRAGYFDARAVRHWETAIHRMRPGFRRLFIEMGLVGVMTTQLWHQQYFDAGLADLPVPACC